MLLKVVFNAYMNNIYSCRKIEDALKYHIHYMWLSGSQTPLFSTINRFRSEHMKDAVKSSSPRWLTRTRKQLYSSQQKHSAALSVPTPHKLTAYPSTLSFPTLHHCRLIR